MKKSDPADLSQPTRAAQAYIGIALAQFIGRFVRQIWPLLLLWLINPGKITGVFILLSVATLSGISTFFAILAYYQFDYCIREGALQIRSGVIRRKEQSIPFERIQSIHIEELALHRLFGVVRLKVETAGSKDEEGVIEALEPAVARAIKGHIEGQQGRIQKKTTGKEPGEEQDAKPVSILNIQDLFKIGLTRNHIRTAAILLGFSIGFMEDLTQLLPDNYTMDWNQEIDRVFDWEPVTTFILFAIFLFISVLITIVTTFFRFYGQQLVCSEDRWTLRSGLISRREWVIPVRKIQEISFSENPFQRWLRIGELRIKTASSNEVGDEQVIRLSGIQYPLFEELIGRFENQMPLDAEAVRPATPFRWRLWLFIGILPGLLFLLLFGLPLWARIVLGVVYWIVSYFWTGALHKSYALFESESHLLIWKGFGWRSVKWAPWQKMQAVQFLQGIYEQRRALATLVLSHGAGTVSFPFVERQAVLDMMNRALKRIESTHSDWS